MLWLVLPTSTPLVAESQKDGSLESGDVTAKNALFCDGNQGEDRNVTSRW
jgi:hypothetical protein